MRNRLICDVVGTFISVLSWNMMKVVNFSHSVLSSEVVGKKFNSKKKITVRILSYVN